MTEDGAENAGIETFVCVPVFCLISALRNMKNESLRELHTIS
jgi:hypothetical protein